MIYAFSPEGIACVAAVMATRPLLAFDIDGTLAPIVDEPGAARLPAPIEQCLAELARRYELAIITGRAVADARRMFPFEPRYLVGNHGAEGIARWAARSRGYLDTVHRWRNELATCETLTATGVAIEDKRYSLSLHYRRASDGDAAYRAIRACVDQLEPAATIIEGKAVVNLLPPGAPNKGDALRALIDETKRPTALYVGDDETDEAVFGLDLPSVLTVRVEPSGDSRATLFLRDQHEVLTLLHHIARL